MAKYVLTHYIPLTAGIEISVSPEA